MNVLVVEDEVFIALEMEAAIIDAGHECIGIATDREEALALAPRADAALVDLNLRDGPTGQGLGADLADEYGLTVVYTTADPQDLETAADGTLGVLPKPVSALEVRQLIDFLVSHQFAGRTAAEPPFRLTLFHRGV